MVKMKCKCGQQELTFPNLKESDFPQGLMEECCEKNLKAAPKANEKPVEPEKEAPIQEPVVEPAPAESEEKEEESEKPDPKKKSIFNRK